MTFKEEEKLQEALEETFPASDPVANTVETGIRVDIQPEAPSQPVVRDNRDASRFEVAVDGEVAFLNYERRPDSFVLVHTEVPESFRGRGIASQLARVALQAARAEGVRVVVLCPFIRAYLRKHPDERPD
jgi:predicted GNAT family acetyltransferase